MRDSVILGCPDGIPHAIIEGRTMPDDQVLTVDAPAAWRRAVAGFVAGAFAVLVFHQGMLALLHAAGVTPATPYNLTPTPPLGVPQLLSSAFWGGVWGILFATLLWSGRRTRRDWIAAVVFGAVLLTLVAWFVVAPLKHRPLAAGGVPAAMLTGILVNAAWGIGTMAVLALIADRSNRGSP
jgi:hypothetical protein